MAISLTSSVRIKEPPVAKLSWAATQPRIKDGQFQAEIHSHVQNLWLVKHRGTQGCISPDLDMDVPQDPNPGLQSPRTKQRFPMVPRIPLD
jgi:hypothetical protein